MSSDRKALQAIKDISRAASGANADVSINRLMNVLNKSSFSTPVVAAACVPLMDLGELVSVIDILQKCVEKNGESEIVYSLMGQAALRLQIPDLAEKAYTQAYHLNPEEASHLLHVAIAIEKQGRADEAIDLLAKALERFPEYAKFWDALGNFVADYKRDRESAISFISEALRLAPDSADIQHNMALKLYGSGDAKKHYKKALLLEPENAQIHLSYATYLLADHQYFQAREHYDYRLQLHKGTKKGLEYAHDIPVFKRGSLVGKSIVVYAEQGIGDEVYFSFVIPAVAKKVKKIYLVCDPRLVEIYRRSFPNVEVYGFEDDLSTGARIRNVPGLDKELEDGLEIDYCCYAGSLFLISSPDVATYQSYKGGFLVPEKNLVKHFKGRSRSTGRRSIGIAWRSGNVSGARSTNYLDLEFFLALAKEEDADFYVLQYDCTDEEKAAVAAVENIHFFEDIDLKQDIEANIALMASLDAVIAPGTATLMFSVAVGAKSILLSPSKPWTVAGDTGSETICGQPIGYIKYQGVEQTLPLVQPHLV